MVGRKESKEAERQETYGRLTRQRVLLQGSVVDFLQQSRVRLAFAHKLSHWRHSGGFQVYCSQTVETDDRQALERLAAYILRPSFAATRLRYQPGTGQVRYRTAKGVARSMDALDWIAQVVSHIPDPGAQMVRYYGWYSNASAAGRLLPGCVRPVPYSQP